MKYKRESARVPDERGKSAESGVPPAAETGRSVEPQRRAIQDENRTMTPHDELPPSSARRRFLKRAALSTAGAAVLAGGYAWGVEPHRWELVRRELPLPGLPRSWHGRKLLHLSDLHVGTTSAEYLIHSLQSVSDLQASLIVVTGDYMTLAEETMFERTLEILAHLKRPPLGVLTSFGNHEYGEHWIHADVGDAWERRLLDIGFVVLRNQAVEVDGLRIVGLDDLWGPRFSRRTAARLLNESRGGPSIVLCHNPDACDLPIWSDYRGWILAGHTHGGQCKPPWLPPPLVPIRNRRYAAGLVQLADERTLYVNRGLGHTLRARFNCRPEVTEFTLCERTESDSAS